MAASARRVTADTDRHVRAWFHSAESIALAHKIDDPEMIAAAIKADENNRLLVAANPSIFEALDAAGHGPNPDGRTVLRLMREIARSKAQMEGVAPLGQIGLRTIERALEETGDFDNALGLIVARSAHRQAGRHLRRCHQVRSRYVSRIMAPRVTRSRGHAPRRGRNTRRRGSSRTTAASDSRGDPPDEPDPEPSAPGPGARRLRHVGGPTRGRHRRLPKGAAMNAAADHPDQLELGLPYDPVPLARLTTPERGRRYRKAGLDPLQIAAAEEAVRLVLRRDRRAAR
jgi:hypothetical protein